MTKDREVDDDVVIVTFACTRGNWEKLQASATRNGDTHTDTINRAIAMKDAIETTEPGHAVLWSDTDATQHALNVIQ